MKKLPIRSGAVAACCIAAAIFYYPSKPDPLPGTASLEQAGVQRAKATPSTSAVWGGQGCNDAGTNPFASSLQCDPSIATQLSGSEEPSDESIMASWIRDAIGGNSHAISQYEKSYEMLCDVTETADPALCNPATRAENNRRFVSKAEGVALAGDLQAQLAVAHWWLRRGRAALDAHVALDAKAPVAVELSASGAAEIPSENPPLAELQPAPGNAPASPLLASPELQKATQFFALAAARDPNAEIGFEALKSLGFANPQ